MAGPRRRDYPMSTASEAEVGRAVIGEAEALTDRFR
jgi:hypothetical protein